jgi:hypothetical protein
MDGAQTFSKLTDGELSAMFGDPEHANRFPLILSYKQAGELIQVPAETIASWRKAGRLKNCSRRVGKHVRILRDRFLQQIFNEGINGQKTH